MHLFLQLIVSLVAALLTLPVLLLASPFWMMSAAARFASRILDPKTEAPDDLIRFDATVGWRPVSNLNAHYLARNDDVYSVVTDADGWPGRPTISDSDVVVVGDSFAYGYGVHPSRCFTALFNEVTVKAVGCPGYDLVQEFLLIDQLGPDLAGKLVVWFVYLENDLPDSLRPNFRTFRKPFVSRHAAGGDWEIVGHHVRRQPWHHSVRENNAEILAHLCTPGPLSDRYYSACEYLIARAKSVCDRHGATLAVMTIPAKDQLDARGHRLRRFGINADRFDPRYPDTRLWEICERLNVDFTPLMDVLEASDYKRFEGFHWEASGHRKAAGAIRRAWRTWKGEPSTQTSVQPLAYASLD